jgi:predicted AAA+ superfamily ATPase
MFDTGFVAYFRGWDALRSEDRGYLLEHLVLAELQARFVRSAIHYWRDKQKHEVDFVLAPARGRQVTAIECKTASSAFDPSGLAAFRRRHPAGRNLLICLESGAVSERRIGGLAVEIVPYEDLATVLDSLRIPRAT